MKNANAQVWLSDAYDEYADALFRHCYFRIGDRERACELMQDTFMKTWEYLTGGNVIKDLRPFLYKTANNLVVDHLRRKSKRKEESFEDLQEKGFDVASDEDSTRKVEKKFTEEQIKEPEKTAIILRYIDELSPKEIAEALDVSANVVSVRINRGMKMLQSLLNEDG